MDAKEGKARDVSVRLPPLLARVNDTLLVGGLNFGESLWCCDVCIHSTCNSQPNLMCVYGNGTQCAVLISSSTVCLRISVTVPPRH